MKNFDFQGSERFGDWWDREKSRDDIWHLFMFTLNLNI